MQNKKTDIILNCFPKKREVLPITYQKIYTDYYCSNRVVSSTASKNAQQLEKWMHKKVATLSSPELRYLELGFGNLNQFSFENEKKRYDIVKLFEDLYAKLTYLKRVNYLHIHRRERIIRIIENS
jgi:hypothetical protein